MATEGDYSASATLVSHALFLMEGILVKKVWLYTLCSNPYIKPPDCKDSRE